MKRNRLLIALTGASGVEYGVVLSKYLREMGYPFDVIYTNGAEKVYYYEMGKKLSKVFKSWDNVYTNDDMSAPFASGTYPLLGMVIVPCSMKTLGLIANGIDLNLVARAASVQLKEGRKLVLVVRESPYSLPMIENMKKVALAGATILPASPGFYHKPKNIQDLINHVVGKILDQFQIDHDLFKRWGF